MASGDSGDSPSNAAMDGGQWPLGASSHNDVGAKGHIGISISL